MFQRMKAWNDYFSETSRNIINSQKYTTRKTPTGACIHIYDCLFRSISSKSGHGGALYCSATYFLVESSSFFSCNTSGGYGGAICFNNTNSGQSVLHGVCGYDCCSTYTTPKYQFAYICVNNGESSKNYVNYSSISRSVNENSQSNHNLGLSHGKICCPSANISLNKCGSQQINYFSFGNSVTCSFSFASFVDNFAIQSALFYLYTPNCEIKSCNILRNTQGSPNSFGTIYIIGNLMIEDSCILENNANYIFYQLSSSNTITLSNCTIDRTSSNGYLTTQNTVTISFILALSHMSTLNCHAEYDSAIYLTPNTPPLSPSKEQRYDCTCGKFFYQLPLGNFF
jgi:hypothetical protein